MNWLGHKLRVEALLALALCGAAGQAAAEGLAPDDNANCLACHGDPAGGRLVDPARFTSSVHGALQCTDCHADVTAIPHDIPLASISQSHIPETCGQCHADIQQAFQRSIHGQAVAAGMRHAPVCTDCHGDHYIAAVKTEASQVFPSHIPETCGQCHAAQRIVTRYRLPGHVVSTYMESFHGLSLRLGNLLVANCASCHGTHEILPSSDPRSSIHPANLPNTCGQCHAGVNERIAAGFMHGPRAPTERNPVRYVQWFYATLILFVAGGMLLHNALDFRQKVARHYQEIRAQVTTIRMSRNERWQHGILALAFVMLAYTGLALKFPQAWWASPFVGHFDWRSWGHRGAALVFMLLAGYHLWFITATQRGRQELAALWLRREDLAQPFQMLGFYVGWRRERPRFARYSYVEKLEYWALVWGSLVMTVTGGILVGRSVTLRWLPKWFIDVVTAVHYYEAILACLAILIWHGYWVMFDPDEYPMKWTWLTGRASPQDQAHRDFSES